MEKGFVNNVLRATIPVVLRNVSARRSAHTPPASTVLCADRVGLMTKTYNDIDAVTRLLEEVGCSIFTCSIGKHEKGGGAALVVFFSSCFPTNRKREIWNWPQDWASRS